MTAKSQPFPTGPCTLTDYEFADAVSVGLRRMLASNQRGLNHASTYKRGHIQRLVEEIVGACGERIFCKATGTYWPGSVDTFHSVPDVGGRIEIRATARDDGALIIRDNDPADRVYVLVTGEPPTMTIRGWFWGHEAKSEDGWRADPNGYRPAWFVPQSALRRPVAK